MYIAYYLWQKKVRSFTSLSSFPKKYLRLPAFTSFDSIHTVCTSIQCHKNLPKKFLGYEVICEKHETFSPQVISNI